MALHVVKRGLDLPIPGAAPAVLEPGGEVGCVALLASDTHGLRAKACVEPGDTVAAGAAVFEDRRQPAIRFAAPGPGRVIAVHRGARRALQSVVIELSQSGRESAVDRLEQLDVERAEKPEGLKSLLLESGLWTSLRTRPFSAIPDPRTTPHSIFVTAMDSEPLAPDIGVIIEGRQGDLERGLRAISTLTSGVTYFCKSPAVEIDVGDAPVRVEEFRGAHPSGTVGLHVHLLDPVNRNKTVWQLGLQDVLAIGHLLNTSELDNSRVIALAGPSVKKPKLIRTRLGAAIDELVNGELEGDDVRVLSGSVLNGRIARGQVHGYLGRYHQQVCALPEGRERELFGWMRPAFSRFSLLPVVGSRLFGPLRRYSRFEFTTSTYGGRRAIIPIGAYERVMPMDLMATHLLRAISVGDAEWSEELGVLELDEEDLALCAYVCPGKLEYGPKLREVLDELGGEG